MKIVDACDILKDVISNESIVKFSLNKNFQKFENFNNFYISLLGCQDPCDKPVKCLDTVENSCNNIVMTTNCCNLCVFPNNHLNRRYIQPNNTIVCSSYISPNNVNACQE